MRWLTFVVIILFSSILIIACKKQKPTIITRACISADRYYVKLHDTIIFTNCSAADYASIGFKRKGAKLVFLTTDKMLPKATLLKTFSDTGIFLAVVTTYMNSGNYSGDIDSSLAITTHP